MEERTYADFSNVEIEVEKLRINKEKLSPEEQKKYAGAFNKLTDKIVREVIANTKINIFSEESISTIERDAFFIAITVNEDTLITGVKNAQMSDIYNFVVDTERSYRKILRALEEIAQEEKPGKEETDGNNNDNKGEN